MRLILPIEPLHHHFPAGFYLIIKLSPAEQKLIDHAALIEKNKVEHKPQRRRRNDYREKIYRAEHLCTNSYGVHEQRKNQRNADLKNYRAHDQQQRVFQCDAHIRVCKKALIVHIPRRIHALRRTPETAYIQKRIYYILKERIVQEYYEEQERRDQKYKKRRFFLVYH